jgi:hypothetical protein
MDSGTRYRSVVGELPQLTQHLISAGWTGDQLSRETGRIDSRVLTQAEPCRCMNTCIRQPSEVRAHHPSSRSQWVGPQ